MTKINHLQKLVHQKIGGKKEFTFELLFLYTRMTSVNKEILNWIKINKFDERVRMIIFIPNFLNFELNIYDFCFICI